MRADIHDGQEHNVPFKGRIQKRKTYHLQIVTFGLPRAAGPYRSAIRRHMQCSKSRWNLSLAIAATRQAHCKHRTFAHLARHGHVATHHARELARKGKAEPRSPVSTRSERISLGELLE